jgi:hypothetical protein
MKRKRQMTIVEFVIKQQWESQQRGVLSMWTIYNHPRDFPDSYVARRYEIAIKPIATDDMIVGRELNPLRNVMIEAGLTVITRNEEDDALIIETWL